MVGSPPDVAEGVEVAAVGIVAEVAVVGVVEPVAAAEAEAVDFKHRISRSTGTYSAYRVMTSDISDMMPLLTRYRSPHSPTPPNPDPKVTEIENATQSALNLGKLSLNNKFPQRPAFGTEGKPVTLWANYVQLVVDPKLVLYSYEIEVKPEAVGKKLVQIVRLLLDLPELAELRSHLVTNFKSTLISRMKLPVPKPTEGTKGTQPAGERIIYSVPYRAEQEDEPKTNATTYKVELKFTHTLPISNLIDYLTSSTLSSSQVETQPTIQALNIFLNHYSKTNAGLATIGTARSFPLRTDYDGRRDLGDGLQVIRGFFASVRAATARILVNVNVSYGAFYKPGPLVMLMDEFMPRDKIKLGKFIKGVRITPKHLKPKKNKSGQEILKRKTIIGLATPKDGHGLLHPPKISGYGAGPKDVEFWLEQKTSTGGKEAKGGKGSKTTKSAGQTSSAPGKYISVFEFFKQSRPI